MRVVKEELNVSVTAGKASGSTSRCDLCLISLIPSHPCLSQFAEELEEVRLNLSGRMSLPTKTEK